MVEREALLSLIDQKDCLTVRVTPNARSERLAIDAESDDGAKLKIWVTVPPEDGKANKAVIKLLAKALGLPKSALDVERGETSRTKLIRVRR